MRNAIKNQTGFTLIEITVAILIAGIMAGGALSLYRNAEAHFVRDVTQTNMQTIASALSTFAESSGRLPCPADPGVPAANGDLFGWEWGVLFSSVGGGRPTPPAPCQNWATPPAAGASAPVNVGIVPFLALGIPEESIKDGWGRYITYAVSPVFAQINDNITTAAARSTAAADDQGRAHVSCHDGSWYDNEDNVNAVKAKFCCARDGQTGSANFNPGTDIQIVHTDGTQLSGVGGAGEYYLRARDGTQTNYVFVDPHRAFTDATNDNDSPYIYTPNVSAGGNRQASTLQSENGQASIAAPAFVLVSHGENGDGAFLVNNTRNRVPASVAGAVNEIQNTDDDQIFAIGPQVRVQGEGYFDDTVLWRTQHGVMAENGSSSCGYP